MTAATLCETVTPSVRSIHIGDHLLIDGNEIVVDSELTATVDENDNPILEFDRHYFLRDSPRLRGAGDQFGVTRLRADERVTICKRGAP